MLIVEQMPSHAPPPGSISDALELTWEQRHKTRQRVVTEGGREIGIKLPTATRLRPGAVVYVGEGFHVIVTAAAEDVWSVRCDDALQLARVAYELGQRHLPVELGATLAAVRYDHTLEDLWRRLGVWAQRVRQPFLAESTAGHRHE